MGISRTFSILLHTLVAASLAVSSFAASDATLTGRITDPQGGVIPEAVVKATNVGTNVSSTSRTNPYGLYVIQGLPPGRYSITVEKAGFETVIKPDVVLHTEDVVGLNFSMQLGTVKQSVTVAGGAPLLETQTTQMGDVITGSTMVNLPLNGRSYTDLLGLQPGVVPISVGIGIDGGASYGGSTATGNMSINGQREDANGFMVNGGNVEESRNNGAGIVPNLDSIAEFRVLTSNFDAEYGHYSGGLISVVTKSGTNKLHGSGFEFLRNEKLDSRSFYAIDREEFRRNQFGGTLGGPIKGNRAFFFVDYQGTREIVAQPSGRVPVPSADERNGLFADPVSVFNGNNVNGAYWASVLSNRVGYTVTSGEPYYVAGCTSSTQCVFPNGVIPQSAFSAPAKNLMQYIPLANSPGGYFVSSANKWRTRDDRAGVRVDANSRFGMLSAYYFVDSNFLLKPFGVNPFPGFPTAVGGRPQQINLSSTKSFGANSVNTFRFNFTRYVAYNDQPTSGYPVKLSSMGFNEDVPGGIVPSNPSFEGVPSIVLNSFGFGLPGIFYQRHESLPQWIDTFSKVSGRHTLKLGGEYHYTRFQQRF